MKGILIARFLPPDLTEEEFLKWWPRLLERERDKYTIFRSENMILPPGKQLILTSGINASSMKYFAVGTGAFTGATSGDSSLASELFRKAPTSFTQSGNQITVSTLFTTSQGNGTYTNAGLFGGAATGAANSGTLETHAGYSITKTSAASLTNDYVFLIN